MKKLAHEIYSFDEFKLDLTRGALFRGLDELKLRPKSFDVLKYFAENSGRLISKDELIEAVWHETAVTDDSLVQCLKDIRNALGDQSQTIIRTVPRRGYIFEREVSENGSAVYVEETSGVHVVIEESEETNGHGDEIIGQRELAVGKRSLIVAVMRHKIATAAAAAGLTAVVIAGIFFYRPVLAWWFKPPSIAILPMLNTTGDAELDYVSDGLTESIITSLVQLNTGSIPRLRVTAYNTVNIFKGKEIEPRSVGQQLGVENVLVAKMFRQDGLRIFKFELINVADGSIVWSKQDAVELGYGVGLGDDFLEMQNRIARDLVAQLPLSLSDADRESLTRRYTRNAEAYDAYLKGRAAFRKATTPSSLIKSIEYYQQAIDLDPNFATAYWAMGISHVAQGLIGEVAQTEANEKAVDRFRKALKIDNTLTGANNAMKLISDLNSWNWEAIAKAGPRHPGYSNWNGGYLIAMGRLDEQLEIEKRSLSFEPYNPPLNFSHATTLFLAHRYDEAIAQYRKTLNITGDGVEYFGPESPWIHVGLGNTYTQKGMYAEAIVEMNKAKDLAEGSEGMWASLGYATAKSGQRDEAIKILNQLLERESDGKYVPPLNIAAIYIALDDKDRAFVYLEKAFDDRMDRLRLIKTHPFYDPIRSDPRFIDLIRRMGLPP